MNVYYEPVIYTTQLMFRWSEQAHPYEKVCKGRIFMQVYCMYPQMKLIQLEVIKMVHSPSTILVLTPLLSTSNIWYYLMGITDDIC